MIRRLAWFVVAAALWLVLPARADERILDFHSDITVRADASLQVREIIRVRCEGNRIRHGIFRDFPTRYRDRLGNNYVVGLAILRGHIVGGEEDSYHTEQLLNGVRIKLGDPVALLSPGDYTFELVYTVTRELGFFDDHDELYWNVNGLGWQFPADHVSATVTLPVAVDPARVQLAAYTGPKNSKDQNFRSALDASGTISFATTHSLGPEEGLTVVVGFPKGLVTEPTREELVRKFWEENLGVAAGGAGLVVVMIYFAVVWFWRGRDPRRGAIMVLYEPPPELSPAAMRYLQRMGYDHRVFACAVVNLAVKGFLSIQEHGASYELKRRRRPDATLPPEEAHLMEQLFSTEDHLSVGSSRSETIRGAVKTLTEDLKAAENLRLFRRNTGWFAIGILLSVATTAGILLGLEGDTAPFAFGLSFWLLIWTVGTSMLIWQVRNAWKAKRSGTAKPGAQGPGAAAMIASVFTFFELLALGAFVWLTGVWVGLIIAALVAANVLFHHLLKAPTPEGRRLLDKVEGFAEYLRAVHGSQLSRLDAPGKSPALWEKYLPYAMALGLEQQWGRQFAEVLAAAATAGGGTAVVYTPRWYRGGDFARFDHTGFSQSFGESFSSVVSSASSPPGSSSGFSSGSSGFSSGGSSGGGGGGGGGGGW